MEWFLPKTHTSKVGEDRYCNTLVYFTCRLGTSRELWCETTIRSKKYEADVSQTKEENGLVSNNKTLQGKHLITGGVSCVVAYSMTSQKGITAFK
jgi:hypothetical protein